ncbi:sugar transferase [Hyphomonas sp.]|uniref:sugar transferase n=1 Tax=Hyphomonas sp. TaxID=87 RepID=UPI00391B70B3
MDFRITDTADGVETDAFTENYVRAESGDPRPSPPVTAKRVLDVTIAVVALIFVAPVLLTVGILIRLQDGEKAIFPHTRYGMNGRTFKCLKLRSMVPDAAERLQALLESDPAAKREWDETQKLTHDPRVTPLGKFIRASSIDELPQLINVIRGDMSLVGPRPISMSERSRYGEGFADYCSVRPGITGKWQISGRSNVSYPERVAMDVTYARTRTFWGDVMIMLKTVPAVLFSVGAR